MNFLRPLLRFIPSILLLPLPLVAQTAPAADPCALPTFPQIAGEKNIFSEEQEEWLGEIMDQSFRKEFHELDDPEGRVQALGERLLAQLPPTKIHYRFVLVDSPELNSFGLAGGRIYIFRRMVGFVQNEDELAFLLGHEIGHVVTHQAAIDVSRWFSDLGVREVGDRQDIFNKWNYFEDHIAKIHSHGGANEQKEQMIADRIAVYAMARAGYDPAYAGTFADRLFLTKGKTGGFWSDFFGRTRPENTRLREILRSSTALPAQCVTARTSSSANFAQWQATIIGATRSVAKEDLPGLLSKVALKPPLRGDLDRAKFSPDGKYLLAQDESSIFVLSREPLNNLFRIDAPGAYYAEFTPDSRGLVFYDKELRVERWDIASRQRTSVRAVNASRCWGSGLSPTGEVLACARPEFEKGEPFFELQLIDVATAKPFLVRDKFYELSFGEWLQLELLLFEEEEKRQEGSSSFNPSLFNIRFSPDGRYLVVARGSAVLAYDLTNRAEVKMPSSFKDAIFTSFTFITPDEIAGFNQLKGKVARIQFPSGHTTEEFAMLKRRLSLSSVGKGNFILVRGGESTPVAVLDLGQKRLTIGYKAPAFDTYDPFFAGEEVAGEMVLGSLIERKPVAQIELPDSPLGALSAASFSGDGKWLAVSGHSRGAVWSLETGERVFYMTHFDGASFDSKGQLFVRFPSREKVAAHVGQLDPFTKATAKLYDLTATSEADQSTNETGAASNVRQAGDLLLAVKPKRESWLNRNYLLEVRDIRTNSVLWQRKFEREQPRLSYSTAGKTLTLVIANYDNIKDAAREDGRLREQLDRIDAKKETYLIQALNGMTGEPLGAVLVDTGKLSFKVDRVISAGDAVVVDDSINRTLVYSLKSGQQNGKVFGRYRAISGNGDKLLVENGAGNADIYETASLKPLVHMTLPAAIVYADFAADGNSVFVLTADQRVYRIRASDSGKAGGMQ